MAHLQPSWPDQVLCKENKRKALTEQHRRWMDERRQALSRERPAPAASGPAALPEEEDDELGSLEDLNRFLADVGRTIGGSSPQRNNDIPSSSSYEETNAMLRQPHAALTAEPAKRGTGGFAQPSAPSRSAHETEPSLRSQHRRSAAQREAAERLVQPAVHPAQQCSQHRAVPAPLIGSEDFYRRQQEGICHYRRTYDARVEAHFDALASDSRMARALPAAPNDAIGAIAHENAVRHLVPISQLVHGSSSSRGETASLRWRSDSTSEKSAGRRGGRVGRSGSVHAALQAAKLRGPML